VDEVEEVDEGDEVEEVDEGDEVEEVEEVDEVEEVEDELSSVTTLTTKSIWFLGSAKTTGKG